MKRFIQIATFTFLILFLFFVSCKKEHAGLQGSPRDTTFDYLPPDYKLDTLFSYIETPPRFAIIPYYVSRRSFYLPILKHINTKNLKVEARYGNHPFVELLDQFSWAEDYLTVSIQINELVTVRVSVRITT